MKKFYLLMKMNPWFQINVVRSGSLSVTGAPPRRVKAEALNSSSIRVSWLPPLSVKHQGQVMGYHLIGFRLENGQPHGQQILLDVPVDGAQVWFLQVVSAGE